MRFGRRFDLVLSCALGAFTIHCGGKETSISSGSSASGDSTGASGSSSSGMGGVTDTSSSGAVAVSGAASSGSASSGSSVLPEHRPQPVDCTPSNISIPATKSCTTNADCVGDSGNVLTPFCLANKCSADECLADSDCGDRFHLCVCANQFRGNAVHGNACRYEECRVDADCASGLCSPTYGYCGTSLEYHCRSPADTCRVNADCANPFSDSGLAPPECIYDARGLPELAGYYNWRCLPAPVCGW